MADGTLSARRRQQKSSEAEAGLIGSGNGLLDEQIAAVGQGHVKDRRKAKPLGDANEIMVEGRRKKRLRDYDRLLKSFKYSAALDAVLRKVVTTLPPRVDQFSDIWIECSTSNSLLPSTGIDTPRWPEDCALRS